MLSRRPATNPRPPAAGTSRSRLERVESHTYPLRHVVRMKSTLVGRIGDASAHAPNVNLLCDALVRHRRDFDATTPVARPRAPTRSRNVLRSGEVRSGEKQLPARLFQKNLIRQAALQREKRTRLETLRPVCETRPLFPFSTCCSCSSFTLTGLKGQPNNGGALMAQVLEPGEFVAQFGQQRPTTEPGLPVQVEKC